MPSQPQALLPAVVLRSRGFRLTFVGLLATLLLLPAGTASVAAADQLELTGDVAVEYAEDYDEQRVERYTMLETNKGRFRLKGERANELEPGMRVRVRGKSRGETIELAASGGSVTTLSEGTLATPGSRPRVAVLLINFGTSSATAARPWSRSQVRDLYFDNRRSVTAYYSEVSNGAMALRGDVFGWYTIKASTSSCRHTEWASAGRSAASAAGVDLSGFDYIVHAFPRVSACWWGGLAQVGGRYSWINGSMTPYVTMHELGHNFGAHHASSMTCTQNGTRVPLSSNCSVSDYGDPHDVMGQNASGPSKQRHLHAWHRRQVGFMGSSEQHNVRANGHYEIAPAATAGGSPRLVRIARPATGDYFYLEYRRPYGLFDDYSADSAAVNGVLVRIAPASARVPSKLIDMNPATSGFSDAALALGQSFTDVANQISLRTTSLSSHRAVVRIQIGPDNVPPTAPAGLAATIAGGSTVTLSWKAATDDLEVAGYRVRRDGALVGSLGASARSFSQSSLASGSYTYAVTAIDSSGNLGPAATVSVSLGTQNISQPLSAPTNLRGRALDRRYVQLSWTASSGSGVTYRIFRNDRRIASGVRKAEFLDRAPSVGTYTYKVRAVDSAGRKSAFTPKITIKAVRVVR